MHFKNFLLSTFLFTSVLSAQTSVGLDINEHEVEFLGSLGLDTLTGYAEGGTSFAVEANYLHTQDDNLFSIGIVGENQLQGLYGISAGVGLKAVFTEDYSAIPLLARAAYTLPLVEPIPTTKLEIHFAYAPSVLSFSDADGYYEFRSQLDMEIVSNIHIFGGYRNIDTDYETYEKNFNESFYGGLKLNF